MDIIKIKHFLENNISTIMYVVIFLLGFFAGRSYPDILNQVVILTQKYSSLIVAIATVLLVMVTISFVNVTKNQDKPWLHFYFKESTAHLEITENGNARPRLPPQLCVKNVGKGPAIEIEFKIEQTKESLRALAPNEEVNINGIHFDSSNKSNKIKIKGIKYNDLNNQFCKQNDVTLQT